MYPIQLTAQEAVLGSCLRRRSWLFPVFLGIDSYLSKEKSNAGRTIGVTSANLGKKKTLVASILVISLTPSYESPQVLAHEFSRRNHSMMRTLATARREAFA